MKLKVYVSDCVFYQLCLEKILYIIHILIRSIRYEGGANMRKQIFITIIETVSIGIFAIIAFYFIYGAIHSYLGLGAVFPHLEV